MADRKSTHMHNGKDFRSLRGIIFDCDGVVIDSWASTRYYFNRIREGVGLGPMTREEEQFVFVSTVEEGITHIVPHDLAAKARLVQRSIHVAELLPHLREQSGIRAFLSYVRGLGLRTAVNTNGGEENRSIIAALGLLEQFDQVVTADEVARGKPDPEGVRCILAYLGLKSEEVVFVGDSHVDQDTARAAGVGFWAFANAQLEADRHVTCFDVLRKEFQSQGCSGG